ncbi:MAG TPA: rod shape-determining protein MreC [Chloroflexota bacterium]|nr:rod shape-determining protein MreC [Chloroflexota bacterium]HEX2184348.1 rod shape-determining protein MreC [Chloroflexota bacterium]
MNARLSRRPILSVPASSTLVWLLVFAGLSVGATVANARHLLDAPRDVASRVVAPLQTGVSRVAHGVSSLLSGWNELSRLRAENAALRQTVDELLQETVTLRSAELENRELREQLRFAREHAEETLLPAEVIGFDSSTLLGMAFINRGSDANIQDGMTVRATAGLVGRVVARRGATSTVLLITDPSSTVIGVVQGTPGATGTLSGQPDGRLLMKHIPQAEPVKVNDIVVTSGLGGAFPPNVPIGRVVHVETRDVEVFQQALVEPFVDFRKLRKVMVVTSFQPTKL